MARIEATCPTCGTVTCSASDFELRIDTYGDASSYAFDCPECKRRVSKNADDEAVELLISEGVRPLPWHVPAEALEVHDGPPLTPDDVLAFHVLLERDDYLADIAQSSP